MSSLPSTGTYEWALFLRNLQHWRSEPSPAGPCFGIIAASEAGSLTVPPSNLSYRSRGQVRVSEALLPDDLSLSRPCTVAAQSPQLPDLMLSQAEGGTGLGTASLNVSPPLPSCTRSKAGAPGPKPPTNRSGRGDIHIPHGHILRWSSHHGRLHEKTDGGPQIQAGQGAWCKQGSWFGPMWSL